MGAHGSRAAWFPHAAVAGRAILGSRLLIWAAGLAAVGLFDLSRRRFDFDPIGLTRPFGGVGDTLAAPAARWDSYWFLSIARDGYDGARAAFFPLYPLALKPAELLAGDRGALIAGVAISLACLLVALTVLHRLTEMELGAASAPLAVVAVALYPMSFFLSAVYSESLFLALSVGAFYAARTDRWALAGVLGAAGAATRSAGVLLVIPLALIWWSSADRRLKELPWIALVPLGLAAFCVGLELSGHDAAAPFSAQETWMRSFEGPFVGAWDGAAAAWDGVRQLASGSRSPVYFEQSGDDPFRAARHNIELFAYLVLALIAVIGVMRRLPVAYGAYTIAALALPLSYPVPPQPLMSLPRFVLVLFPLFMWLGWWLSRGPAWRGRLVLGCSAVLLAFTAARFATWHWVA